jgi:hypothetical protein
MREGVMGGEMGEVRRGKIGNWWRGVEGVRKERMRG